MINGDLSIIAEQNRNQLDQNIYMDKRWTIIEKKHPVYTMTVWYW